MLAAGSGAKLSVLHVVDDDRPAELVAYDSDYAARAIADELAALATQAGETTDRAVLVETGDPFRAIIDVTERLQPDLVVMGAPRRGLLDRFVGTTVERVMRAVTRPVLMVNQPSDAPYGSPLAAIDLSATSGEALKQFVRLGLADRSRLAAVHAVAKLGQVQMASAGVDHPRIAAQLLKEEADARAELHRFLGEAGLDLEDGRLWVETADPAECILQAVRRHGADLLVMGTRGLGALEALLLGSVAQEVLRRTDCDALVVPPAR